MVMAATLITETTAEVHLYSTDSFHMILHAIPLIHRVLNTKMSLPVKLAFPGFPSSR